MQLILKSDEIKIYYIVGSKNLINSNLLHILTSKEIDRANKFKLEKDSTQFIIAVGLLKKILGSYYSIPPEKVNLITNQFGKPVISTDDCPEIKFNLSHSGEMIIYAFSLNEEVGIDIENIDPSINHLEIAEHYFTKYEVYYLKESINKEQLVNRFFRIWTRKEALIKAIGTGMFIDLKQVDTLNNNFIFKKDQVQFKNFSMEKNWNINDLFIDKYYKCAIAYNGSPKKLTIIDLSNFH